MNNSDIVRRCQLEDYLRANEGSMVQLACDNPDSDETHPNNLVIVVDDWTDWQDKTFGGKSVLAALQAAADAKYTATGDAIPPVATESTPPRLNFQFRTGTWVEECFGNLVAYSKEERNHRFIEEALELVQACGCSKEEVQKLVDYVFARPHGEIKQEVGGVMITLAALCDAQYISLTAAAERELSRIWLDIDRIREKRNKKLNYCPLP